MDFMKALASQSGFARANTGQSVTYMGDNARRSKYIVNTCAFILNTSMLQATWTCDDAHIVTLRRRRHSVRPIKCELTHKQTTLFYIYIDILHCIAYFLVAQQFYDGYILQFYITVY